MKLLSEHAAKLINEQTKMSEIKPVEATQEKMMRMRRRNKMMTRRKTKRMNLKVVNMTVQSSQTALKLPIQLQE